MKITLFISFFFLLWACQKDEEEPVTVASFPEGAWENHFSAFPYPYPKTFSNGVSFYLGDAFYVGLGDPTGTKKAFYRFTADKGWTTLNPFLGRDRTSAVAFVLNGKAYVGMGLNIWSRDLLRDFWCYDPASDSWDSLRMDFPVAGRIGAVGFAGNRYAYVGTGSDRERTYADFYRFSPEEGWTYLPEISTGVQNYATVFMWNRMAYLCLGQSREVHKFSLDTEKWTAAKSPHPSILPNLPKRKVSMLKLNFDGKDHFYFISNDPDEWCLTYDPEQDRWEAPKDNPIPKADLYFELNNELYLVSDTITQKFVPAK